MDHLSESMEDYLETIFALEQIHHVARPKDIADRLDVRRGTVTGALKSLNEKGMINYKPYSLITLTPKGLRIAKDVTRRHTVLKQFLKDVLRLAPERAETIACRMEHAIDRLFVERLVQFIEFIDQCPRTGDDWIREFVRFCEIGERDTGQCRACLEHCLDRVTPPEAASREPV